MFEVVTKLDPYEIDGKTRDGLPDKADQLHVRAHWNRKRDFVVLEWHDQSITISARELKIAIENATNTD